MKVKECTADELNPDFVITGGDLIIDALGNYEIFGLYRYSGVDPGHPEYGKKMYQKRIGKQYYSFDHRGWHFMILDSVY